MFCRRAARSSIPGPFLYRAVGRAPENWTAAFGLFGLVGRRELSIVLWLALVADIILVIGGDWFLFGLGVYFFGLVRFQFEKG